MFLIKLYDEKLTGNQWRILNLLENHIRYSDCVVIHTNGKYITAKNISKILNIPERTIYGSLEGLIKNQIIAKVKDDYGIKYIVNPFIFAKRKVFKKELMDLFENSKWLSVVNDNSINEYVDLEDVQINIDSILYNTSDIIYFVYFVKMVGKNYYKIGYTSDINKRIEQLQTSSPYDLEIVYIIDGNKKVEYYLHDLFSIYNIKNEWFIFTKEYFDVIKKSIKQTSKIIFNNEIL